ncbi:MAG: NAD(P)/FAD-dependent oxidoreductase [Roseateles sp.]|uniref:NAD(P)/FAD-dependent oxidoreductase n=1 Tax=Roseateles sp. TaxID=1971397 RepID=UPI0040373D90
MMFDALIVGGSFAGLSAALQLARARRRIAVIDAGQRRNRFVEASHGFLGQDGRAPGDIVGDARAQLLAYPNVSWRDGLATQACPEEGGFEVDVGGEALRARRLVLATGVADELPPVEGLVERWGRTVFHCPYCHGYELNEGAIGVLASSPLAMHHALMLPDWGRVTLFLNGAFEPDAEQVAALAARAVTVEAGPVARLVDAASVELADGRRIRLAGLFTATRTRMASPLAEQLGCDFEEGAAGPYLRRTMMETSVRGVFACGDAAQPFGNVATAVGDGTMTGVAAHRSLIPGL